MSNLADVALARLDEISRAFSGFLESRGGVSEADTRVKLVDRVLKEVCAWPESELSREDHTDSGYTDYQLRLRDSPVVAVEAKREGTHFELPQGRSARAPRLNGTLVTDPRVKSAIDQVRTYCDDAGIKFAIATNGYSWVVFRAIRDDMPWREGQAHLFPSIDYIREHFIEFWNLLSYEAISNGSLDAEFGRLPLTSRRMHRVIDQLFNADLPLRRNRLHLQLQPLIKLVFEDIAAQNDPHLLRACYVYSSSLRIAADDLHLEITDTIPKDVAFAGTLPLKQSDADAGEFGDSIEGAVEERRGELYLLLGGIGSGKTTFLKRFQTILARDFLDKHAYIFSLDFLKAPLTPEEMEPFVWRSVLETLRTRYSDSATEDRRYAKAVFKDRLRNLERTVLRKIPRHSEAYEDAIGPHILAWQANLQDYVPRLLRYACVVNKKTGVLLIDNVDQLDPERQAQVFLLAQRVARVSGVVTVVALREESYYARSVQNAFTAFNTHKFHIASPQFRKMIRTRINYAIRSLATSSGAPAEGLGHTNAEARDISEFLGIVQASVFAWSKKISRLIECICFGNMRAALQMFTTFLTSEATDVDKMLNIYRRDGSYNVAFHEFLKSVMLQDRAYYKEDQSPILNLFNCTSNKNASHFTSMRVIALLLRRRGESAREGRGYVDLAKLFGALSEVFDNAADLTATLDRMLNRQLIEVNTRSPDTVKGASHVRVTAAGWYYLRFLSRTFAYQDLVLQDTPLDDADLERSLRESVYRVNNLADREYEKLERMRVRFDRTQLFLDYLAREEAREYQTYEMRRLPAPLCDQFMPGIQQRFSEDRGYIERRLREGRSEDIPDEIDKEEDQQFELALADDLSPEGDAIEESTE